MSSTDPLEQIAEIAKRDGLRVVTAESLTSGNVATRLGAGPDAEAWFGGGIVAYQEPVKFDCLGVDEGPVVTATCAEQMAQGALLLFNADIAVSTTGVGGPEPTEGRPAGTVFVSVAAARGTVTRERRLEGRPEDVLRQTCDLAIALLLQVLEAR